MQWDNNTTKWVYRSPLDVSTCVDRLCDPNIGSVDDMNFHRVEITKCSDTQVYMVHKGRRFTKGRRTEYVIAISVDPNTSETVLTVIFQREMLDSRIPFTPVSDLDDFFNAAINACRMV